LELQEAGELWCKNNPGYDLLIIPSLLETPFWHNLFADIQPDLEKRYAILKKISDIFWGVWKNLEVEVSRPTKKAIRKELKEGDVHRLHTSGMLSKKSNWEDLFFLLDEIKEHLDHQYKEFHKKAKA